MTDCWRITPGRKNATVIVKGLRAMSDFEYEFQMALTNRKLNPDTETAFLTTTAEHMYLSSSLVKQVAQARRGHHGFCTRLYHRRYPAKSERRAAYGIFGIKSTENRTLRFRRR